MGRFPFSGSVSMSASKGDGSGSERPHLRVVRVEAGDSPVLAGLPVEICSPQDPAENVDAVAVEDDTYFVLGADPTFREPTEHPVRIGTEVHEAEPAPPGSLLIREGAPLRMHAVIHDLSREPTWTEEWVERALAAVLSEVDRRALRRIALPALGAVHGKLPIERFLELLRAALERSRPACMESLVLLAPPGTEEVLDRLLRG